MNTEGGAATESAFVLKYSPQQVDHSRNLLGREPTGGDLAAHHDAPGHGIAGDHPRAVNEGEDVDA